MIETKTQNKIVSAGSPVNKEWYVESFKKFEKSLNGEAGSGLHAVRKAAIERFAELGFPTTKSEEWKYTDVSNLARRKFKPVFGYDGKTISKQEVDQFSLGIPRAHVLVCLNGRYSKELSTIGKLPTGVKLGSLGQAIQADPNLIQKYLTRYASYDSDAFTALSTAFIQDGIFIEVPAGIAMDVPIHVVFVSTGDDSEFVSQPRTLVIAGKSSELALVESHVSMASRMYFNNVVTEVILDENAVVEHDKVQRDSPDAFHVSTMHASLQRNSNLVSNNVTFGGGLVRNNIFAVLGGEGAEATLNGLYLGTGSQHIDNHTTIDHAMPHCPSHELYKGILAGKSRGVFNGKILVRKDAQKTDAKQTNKNLILSDEASIDTKPQLEIFANDVKCTHGATIGQLDEESMFYLRSRGIDPATAKDMLIYAFASDVVNRIKIGEMRETLQTMLHDRLEQARTGA